ncbi:MAG: hypothetical protein ABI912_05505, partial [Actinomycetota bacterium]
MSVAFDAAAVVAALLALWCAACASARSYDRAGQAWMIFALGIGCWVFGHLVTTYAHLDNATAVAPPLADIGHLWALPLWLAALLTFPAASDGIAGRMRTVLDGLLLASSLGFVSWALFARPESALGPDTIARIVALAPPLFDLVAISLALVLIVRARGGTSSPPLLLLGFGFVAVTVSDSATAYRVLQARTAGPTPFDLGWVIGFVALALAAHYADLGAVQNDATRHSRGIGVLLPCGAVVLTLGLTVERQLANVFDGVLVWNLAVLLALLVTRLVLTLLENHGLTRTLEHRVKQRTNALMAHESRFRSLVQFSSDVITILDPRGAIQYQSASVERVFGY